MKRALLIIDMVSDFIDQDGALYIGESGRAIIPVIARLLEQFRAEGAPVFFICDRHQEGDPEFEMFAPHCLEGTKGASICEQLTPREDEPVVAKQKFSGFFGTDLERMLRERGIEELVLTGCCTNICVLYTAAQARMLGFAVTIPREAVASFDADAHRFALKEMELTLGAKLV